jgi:hypothetical protein
MSWVTSSHCRSHAHCFACRNSEAFRESILRLGAVETRDFECPDGLPAARVVPSRESGTESSHAKASENRGLGDFVEKLVKPIAKALRLPCLDAEGKLRPESGCAKRRDALNVVLTGRSGSVALRAATPGQGLGGCGGANGEADCEGGTKKI